MGPKAEPAPTGPTAAGELKRNAEQLTKRLLASASRHFGTKLAEPSIRFDLRGKTAGQVRSTDGRVCTIRYNAHLLERHPKEFLARTVPHETAHVVAFRLFGSRVPPHGREWQAIMSLFGAPPERCHSYDVEGLQTRQLRRYEYRCACRVHRLTSIRHNRVGSWQVYLCRQCGRPLERVPQRSAD
jgi:SprT protein